MANIDFSKEYKKYRWFITSSGKLIIGGKNSSQNDHLLRVLTNVNEDHLVLHTSDPGSPFSIIDSPIKEISRQDILECATFTACFSKAWKEGKSKTLVDVFKSSQIYKGTNMKEGTWGVTGRVQKVPVSLVLAITRQKGVIRAVPLSVIKEKKESLLTLLPGKIDKKDVAMKIQIELNQDIKEEEILAAIPAGGTKVVRT